MTKGVHSCKENDPGQVLVVDLEQRLPDVDSYAEVPQQYERYGRCAILRSGAFWYGEVNSSHPPTTKEGFYWALEGNILYISPRGAHRGFRDYIDDEFIRRLSRKIGLKRRFRYFRLR